MTHALRLGWPGITEDGTEQKATGLTVWQPIAVIIRGNEEFRNQPTLRNRAAELRFPAVSDGLADHARAHRAF
jgi:hypothetical protein